MQFTQEQQFRGGIGGAYMHLCFFFLPNRHKRRVSTHWEVKALGLFLEVEFWALVDCHCSLIFIAHGFLGFFSLPINFFIAERCACWAATMMQPNTNRLYQVWMSAWLNISDQILSVTDLCKSPVSYWWPTASCCSSRESCELLNQHCFDTPMYTRIKKHLKM